MLFLFLKKVSADEVWVYDPLFTPIEVGLLKERGYQLISKNEASTTDSRKGWVH